VKQSWPAISGDWAALRESEKYRGILLAREIPCRVSDNRRRTGWDQVVWELRAERCPPDWARGRIGEISAERRCQARGGSGGLRKCWEVLEEKRNPPPGLEDPPRRRRGAFLSGQQMAGRRLPRAGHGPRKKTEIDS